MKISLVDTSEGYTIQSYAPGNIVINRIVYTRSLIIMPDRLIRDWRPQVFADLDTADFDKLATLAKEMEILILGTGARQRFPAPALFSSIIARGVGFEIMDTAAACRTYNILLSEGRKVAAAMLMI